MTGEKVLQKNFQDQDRVDIDMSNLSKGIYSVRIQTREGVESQKIVVE